MNKIGNQLWKAFCIFITLAVCMQGFSPVLHARAATCTVTSDADSGDGTLRALLADSNCSTIDFGSDMSIHLANPLWITASRIVTIDGSGHAVSITDDNFRRVLTIASGADATLQNITIAQGSNEDYVVASEGSMSESSMIPNFGTLRINNTTVTGNPTMPAGMVGGGIMNRGTLIVNRSTFTGHSALGGGAIYNDGYLSSGQASVMVIDCTFTGNSSWVQGAGDVWMGILGGGGAITNFAGTLSVTGSTFTTNMAAYVGGAIVGYLGSNTITNSTFTDNTAATNGGAAMLVGGMLTNNTFSGNTALNGGALWFYDAVEAPVNLYNNLIVKGGTGLNCSIVIPDAETGMTPGGTVGANNLADDASCGSGFTSISSLSTQIGALSDNGGSTQTVSLIEGSPAIDAGDDSLCPATDQRGVTRPQGAACDIGAYELEQVVSPSDYVISGVVYDDLNANGSRDAGEVGIEQVPVFLALNLDQIPFNYLTAWTIADGSFQFNLTPPAGGFPANFSISVFVQPVTGYKFTQMPAPFTALTGNLIGMDIGVHIVVLTPTPAGFPDGVENVAYNQTITVTGGDAPYTFTPSTWPLPAGLSYAFDEQLGTITLSGTPGEAGEFLAQVDFTDANGAFAQVHEYFTIHPPLQFSPATLPDGSLDTAYSQTITVSGGMPPYAFVMGSEQWLPAGLTLDTSNGNIVISGIPSEAGRVTLDVYVSDQSGTTVEVQRAFWIKTTPSLTLTSSLNPSLEGQPVIFSLGSTATVADWPAPWGQVSFKVDGTIIPGCDGLWLGSNPETEEPAPNPVTCTTSSLAVGAHTITAELTTLYGPYNSTTASLPFEQVVVASAPVLSAISPASTTAGSGDLNLTVTGSNFISNSSVRWNGVDLATTYVSNTQLNALIPAVTWPASRPPR